MDDLLMDPAWYARNDWHPTFRTLRHEDPVHWVEDRRYGHPYWGVFSYEAIREVWERWDLFSSRLGTVPPRAAKRHPPEELHAMGLDVTPPYLDPPVHGLYRRPMNKHFSVPAIARLTAMIDENVDDLIAEVAEKEQFDFVTDVAAQLPMRIIFALLGVPREDWDELQLSVNRYTMPANPAFTIDGDPVKTAKVGRRVVDNYSARLAQARRDEPRDDMATVIGSVKIDGERLSLHEVRSWFSTLIAGSLQTTRNGLGTGIWQFLENPDQRDLLVADESRAADAVEEVLRWGSPSRMILRVANEDLEFRGKEMRAGDWVMLFIASGNRDESVWPDADRFDIARERTEHLGLGHGIHKCLGRNLLRLEMARFFPRFLNAFPELAIAGAPSFLADYNGNGLHTLPLTHHGVVRR
ncbi:cytochrome P450 [Nocardioides alkalitolerans]|uniref:cytochrome P450 n=1 Tax=Nocardioides alkalitolerans TaxID=281714 RepID=UPI00146FAB88|nr:cytochrome P450 [Nocardioides alkalitolerans]